MTTESRTSEVTAYAMAVRGALGDLPEEEKVVLLDDLEGHLSEIGAETEETLTARLGPPEQYAAELRAAYGAAHAATVRRPSRMRLQLARLASLIRREAWYRDVRAFLPGLRPAWWVFRAYLVVLILAAIFSAGRDVRPIPNPFSSRGLLQLIATVVAIVISVRLGQRGQPQSRNLRGLATLANVAVALFAIPMLGSMSTDPGGVSVPDVANKGGVTGVFAGGGTTNIYPYSRDGKPLKDILLYDQDGRPLAVDGQSSDVTTNYPVGADGLPINNAYPLTQRHADGTVVSAPRVAIPPWPLPSPTATPGGGATP